jgi:putative metal binding uncharacterized protein
LVAQYVDPAVSRAKFEREIAEYEAMEAEYRSRGWLLVRARFPDVLVVLAAPKVKPTPVVVGVAFDYTNYDAAPPSVRLVNPFTGKPYLNKELPTQLPRGLPKQEVAIGAGNARMVVGQIQPLMQAHGPDEVPFFCMAGVREYHEHPAHSGDSWELHRPAGAGRLYRLLDLIHRYGIAPITGYAVDLVPQIRFEQGEPPL